jgi:hypothetical protein
MKLTVSPFPNINTLWREIEDDIGANKPCEVIETKFGLSHARFVAWNPAVQTNCKYFDRSIIHLLANHVKARDYTKGMLIASPFPAINLHTPRQLAQL